MEDTFYWQAGELHLAWLDIIEAILEAFPEWIISPILRDDRKSNIEKRRAMIHRNRREWFE